MYCLSPRLELIRVFKIVTQIEGSKHHFILSNISQIVRTNLSCYQMKEPATKSCCQSMRVEIVFIAWWGPYSVANNFSDEWILIWILFSKDIFYKYRSLNTLQSEDCEWVIKTFFVTFHTDNKVEYLKKNSSFLCFLLSLVIFSVAYIFLFLQQI